MRVGSLLVRGAWLLALGLLPIEAVAAGSVLVDPGTMLETAKRVDFVGRNDMAVEQTERGPALRSTPRKSASGLYQPLNIEGAQLTRVTWTWRVDRLQTSADLRQLATEDSGATVFFVFGEPSLFNRDVPTLAYVWSATPVPDGSVIPSARYASLRYIQLHGAPAVGAWQHETRDIAEDYRRIFGRAPETLKYIAIFNDNDQTGEPVSSLFGPILDGR